MFDTLKALLRLERASGLIKYTKHGSPIPGDADEMERTLQALVESARSEQEASLSERLSGFRDLVKDSGIYATPYRSDKVDHARLLSEIGDVCEIVRGLDLDAMSESETKTAESNGDTIDDDWVKNRDWRWRVA